MTLPFSIQKLIFIAGLAQIALALGSLAVPAILKWRAELNQVNLLIKQMFWVYAAYIVVINLCFGLVSVFDFAELTNGSHLAVVVTGFIAVYWISRVLIQFFYFDRSGFPIAKWLLAGETVLVVVFVFLSITYSLAFYQNYLGL